MSAAIDPGQLDAAVVIPYDFARDINRERPANIQFVLNAVDTNTTSIGQGYAESVVAEYSATLAAKGLYAKVNAVPEERGRKSMGDMTPT